MSSMKEQLSRKWWAQMLITFTLSLEKDTQPYLFPSCVKQNSAEPTWMCAQLGTKIGTVQSRYMTFSCEIRDSLQCRVPCSKLHETLYLPLPCRQDEPLATTRVVGVMMFFTCLCLLTEAFIPIICQRAFCPSEMSFFLGGQWFEPNQNWDKLYVTLLKSY